MLAISAYSTTSDIQNDGIYFVWLNKVNIRDVQGCLVEEFLVKAILKKLGLVNPPPPSPPSEVRLTSSDKMAL